MKDTDSSIKTDRMMSGCYDGITDTGKCFRRLRDDHFSFRGWATTATEQWNLCNCLYNFYLYCISGYANDSLYPYIKFKDSFDKAAGYWLFDDDSADALKSLKEIATGFFDTDPDCYRWFNIFSKLGWSMDDVLGKYHDIAMETISFCENKEQEYMLMYHDHSKEYLSLIVKGIGGSFNIYCLPDLAYWSIALSVAIKKGSLDNSWWDRLVSMSNSKADFYNYLLAMEKERDIYDENTRDAALHTVRMALKSMQPFGKPLTDSQTGNQQ